MLTVVSSDTYVNQLLKLLSSFHWPKAADTIELSIVLFHLIRQLSSEKNISKDELMKVVADILDEMAHSQNMKAIRGFAFFLIKVFKALYKRIYVNDEGIQMVRMTSLLCR